MVSCRCAIFAAAGLLSDKFVRAEEGAEADQKHRHGPRYYPSTHSEPPIVRGLVVPRQQQEQRDFYGHGAVRPSGAVPREQEAGDRHSRSSWGGVEHEQAVWAGDHDNAGVGAPAKMDLLGAGAGGLRGEVDTARGAAPGEQRDVVYDGRIPRGSLKSGGASPRPPLGPGPGEHDDRRAARDHVDGYVENFYAKGGDLPDHGRKGGIMRTTGMSARERAEQLSRDQNVQYINGGPSAKQETPQQSYGAERFSIGRYGRERAGLVREGGRGGFGPGSGARVEDQGRLGSRTAHYTTEGDHPDAAGMLGRGPGGGAQKAYPAANDPPTWRQDIMIERTQDPRSNDHYAHRPGPSDAGLGPYSDAGLGPYNEYDGAGGPRLGTTAQSIAAAATERSGVAGRPTADQSSRDVFDTAPNGDHDPDRVESPLASPRQKIPPPAKREKGKAAPTKGASASSATIITPAAETSNDSHSNDLRAPPKEQSAQTPKPPPGRRSVVVNDGKNPVSGTGVAASVAEKSARRSTSRREQRVPFPTIPEGEVDDPDETIPGGEVDDPDELAVVGEVMCWSE